ncbi:MAG: 16S rRNA (cytosine(1402)-N(4))-methyltransferase RsmH [Bryobacteraceae bacterium]|nr:16S rRNA (cytosine(1402)-N(4))-methyltransferase RsmH [Bryobacteraceae bacterium]
MWHIPVLPEPTLAGLGVRPEGEYIDATCGLGGHTGLIAQRLWSGHVTSCDRDRESLEIARRNTAEWTERIRFVEACFSEVLPKLTAMGLLPADGLVADLGVSRYQLTEAERGFSLMNEGPLDMRMDRSKGATAAEIVNFSSERELADLIFQLGEERRSRRIARAIVRARPIRSTLHLASVVEEAVPRTGRLHPATQTFMALRLAVNDEQEELDELLRSLPALVKPGGRAAIISFMSLEDRKVKQAFQALAREGRAKVLTKHVVVPDEQEIEANPASRSAKLRVLELVG